MKKIKVQNISFGPFPTVIVGAEVEGTPNYATVGAYGIVSLKPILYVSLKSTHHTTVGVKKNGYFSINIPSSDLVKETDYCGIVSGKTVNKSEVFTSFYDELGNAPMAKECSMNYLCKVIKTIPMFDFEMFLGEIVAVYVNEDCLTEQKPDPIKINPIIMMNTSYCDLGKEVGNLFKSGLDLKK